MFKLTSFLIFCLLTFAACQDTNNTTDTSSMDSETDEMVQNVAETGDETMGGMIGENFEVKTIDGEIKSPRKELTGTVSDVPVVINYGSPAVNDRTIYGDLVPYNKVWRTGANEATRITFEKPVLVGTEGKKLEAGTYALFTMPASKTEWTIIFNKKADQWGAYDYDEKDDVVKIKGKAMESSAMAERMDFAVNGQDVQLMWADLVVSFPIKGQAK